MRMSTRQAGSVEEKDITQEKSTARDRDSESVRFSFTVCKSIKRL